MRETDRVMLMSITPHWKKTKEVKNKYSPSNGYVESKVPYPTGRFRERDGECTGETSGLRHAFGCHQCTVVAEITSGDQIPQKEDVQCEKKGLGTELLGKMSI